ncbi:MAG: DUF2264 domain-containing protein [Thermoleophilaceae bacterium]|nr:DUF2264 domain-containing protein [Thermoleophilaceae bacterium]
MNSPLATRRDWIDFADELIATYGAFRDPDCTWNVRVPGRAGVHGPECDALEGFARRLLLIAFRLGATELPPTDELLGSTRRDLEAAGLALARSEPGAWPSPATHIQANVEAASIAVSLLLAREELWEALSEEAATGLANWMLPVADRRGDQCNWALFGACVETFLVAVERPVNCGATAEAHAAADAWYRGGGWYGDGPRAAIDYYTAYSFHFYLPLIAHFTGDGERARIYADRLAEFLPSLCALIDGAGRPVAWGRSLTYRFGMLAPLWIDQWLGRAAGDAGTARETTFAVVDSFLREGAVEDGLLTIGWRGPDESVAQDYSGSASPLWAAKAFAGLMLPADHPAWNARAADLPAPGPVQFPAGQIIPDSGSGNARILVSDLEPWNEGAPYEDPFYNRLAYSSATLPVRAGGVPDNSILCADGVEASAIADFDGIELRAFVARGPAAATAWPQPAEVLPLLGFESIREASERGTSLTVCLGDGLNGCFLYAARLASDPEGPRLATSVKLLSQDQDVAFIAIPGGRKARVDFRPDVRIQSVA